MANDPMTLQEIADELGVSKQMAAKIERRALGKARDILARMGIDWEDFVDELRQEEERTEYTEELRGETR